MHRESSNQPQRDTSHPPSRPTPGPIVLKFGGTSVTTPPDLDAVCERVAITAREAPTIVVVSARAGVTDRLAALPPARTPRAALEAGLAALGEEHRRLAREVTEGRERRRVERLIDLWLWTALRAGELPEPEPTLLATGERLSAAILSSTLRRRGLSTRAVDAASAVALTAPGTAGGEALVVDRGGAHRRLGRLRSGEVAVVPGFFGRGADGRLRLLGRGGSDTSATLLGEALSARRVEIRTDVPGVLSAPPWLGGTSRRLAALTYAEARALARFGGKVLHDGCIEPAERAGIPVFVGASRERSSAGTWIVANATAPTEVLAVTAAVPSAEQGSTQSPSHPLALIGSGLEDRPGLDGRVLGLLSAAGITAATSPAESRASRVYRVRAAQIPAALHLLHRFFVENAHREWPSLQSGARLGA